MSVLSELLVDGVAIADFEEYATSLHALMASLDRDGEYFIITCECGVPSCVGLRSGIRVQRSGDVVEWNMREPSQHSYRFPADDYRAAVESGIERAHEALNRLLAEGKEAELVPYLDGDDRRIYFGEGAIGEKGAG